MKRITALALFFTLFSGLAFAESGIKITSPLNGDSVAPGQEITVTVEAVGGFILTDGWAGIVRQGVQNLTSLPQSFIFTVPQDAYGTVNIEAVASGVPDTLVKDRITLNIQQAATLESITLEPKDYYFETDWNGSPKVEEYIYINVKGVYSDGVTRDVSSQGTTYVSSNPAVASVDDNGKVKPLAEGLAIIAVSNSGITATISINVVRPEGIPRSETAPPTTQIDIRPAPNTAGWNNSDVTVTLHAQDNAGGSGINKMIYQLYSLGAQEQFVKAETTVITLSQEGRDTLNYLAVDNEINQESPHSVDFNIDKTQPQIIITTPLNGSKYNLNQNVLADWSTYDGLSGIASANGTVASGAAIDTSSSGTKVFNVVAIDGAGNERRETATYSINSPPVLNDIGSKAANEGQLLQFSTSAVDPDNDPLTFTHPLSSELPQGATFVDNGDGTAVFSWKPNYMQAGTYTIHFEVSDGNLLDFEDVQITVNNVLSFGTIYQVLPEGNTPLEGTTVSVMDITRTNILLSATTDVNGKFAIIGTIPDGNYIIKTEKGSYSTYSGITILRNNQALPFSVALYPPQFASTPATVTVYEGQKYSITISAIDQNPGDKLIFSSQNLPEGAALVDNQDKTANFSWTPSISQVGSHTINFQVTDKLFTADVDLTIEVKSLNNPPALNPILDLSVYEGGRLQFKLDASDPDQGDVLTFSADTLPQGASLNSQTGDFSWMPNFNQKGIYYINFKVSDGKGGEDAKRADITVINSSLYGTVFDRITHRPLPNAGIYIFKGPKLIASAKTDSSGKFVLSKNLPTGLYIVRAQAEGYVPATRMVVLVYDNTIQADFGLIDKKRR